MRALLRLKGHEIDRLAKAAMVDHSRTGRAPAEAIAGIAAEFDAAVAQGPERSVAAYCLGDPAVLDAGTEEIVSWLRRSGVLRPHDAVLDLGCGIGRIAAALAAAGHTVLGLDVSSGMIASAQQRHGSVPGLRFEQTRGHDLDFLPRAGFDLVLAVDSFPYLVQAGAAVAERHVAGAAHCLRRGGRLAILNLSYRNDPAADATDIGTWAAPHGFQVTISGVTPFTLWDGQAFVLRRA